MKEHSPKSVVRPIFPNRLMSLVWCCCACSWRRCRATAIPTGIAPIRIENNLKSKIVLAQKWAHNRKQSMKLTWLIVTLELKKKNPKKMNSTNPIELNWCCYDPYLMWRLITMWLERLYLLVIWFHFWQLDDRRWFDRFYSIFLDAMNVSIELGLANKPLSTIENYVMWLFQILDMVHA